MDMASRVGLCGLIGVFLLGRGSPGFTMDEPIGIAVREIQSLGGEQGFCPSQTIQQELIRKLSSRSINPVTGDSQSSSQAVLITGSVNCSLEKKLRQRGFPLFHEQFIITTAKVSLQLKLIHPATGEVISTPAAQTQAQSETQTKDLGNPLSTASPLQADTLFSQATTSALNQVILQVQTTLNQSGK